MRLFGILFLLSVGVGPVAAQQTPRAVTTADLAILGVPWGADSTALRRILGAPHRIGTYQWPGASERLPAWVYPKVEFDLDITGDVLVVGLRGRAIRTVRGVGIGDSVAVARRAYGDPDTTLDYPTGWVVYPAQDNESVAVIFFTSAGVITGVMFGTVPGMD